MHLTHTQLVAALRDFILHLKLEKGLAENTLLAYGHDLHRYLDFLKAAFNGVGSTEESLSAYLEKITNELKLSEFTLARNLSALRGFHLYLMEEKLLERNPIAVMEAPKLRRKLPSVLSMHEVNAILGTFDKSEPLGLRNRAMLELLYSSGLRVSELVNLEWSQVFVNEGYLRVLGKGNKERLVPVGDEALNMMDAYRTTVRNQLPISAEDSSVVFLNRRGSRLTRVMVFLVIQAAARAAGIRKPVSPHTLRHSFATHLIEGGADLTAVQEMLGHESITTTEIYLHMDQAYLQEVLTTFHPRK
jgi:integrase/recombinase XerD